MVSYEKVGENTYEFSPMWVKTHSLERFFIRHLKTNPTAFNEKTPKTHGWAFGVKTYILFSSYLQ
jgi:hypothetical protein